MERRGLLVQRCMAVLLAICMNISLATGAAGFSQAGNASAMTPDQLDKLLAPVALYPDALLMQVLAASVNSQEVLDGGNWLLQNKSLEGDQLDSAAKAAGFGPAMMALFHFPQVVDMMCSEIDWTKQLGEAFTASQSAVLDSVQRLRLQAKQGRKFANHSAADGGDAAGRHPAGNRDSAHQSPDCLRAAIQSGASIRRAST